MKRKLLLSGALLSLALGSQAQATNCGLAISKTGTGTTKTYTLSVPTSVPGYSFNIYPNAGVTTTGTGLVKTANYTYGGVYYLSLDAINYCTDSIYMQDTVVGPINCAGLSSYLYKSGSGLNWNVNQYVYGQNNAPGYTSTTSYSYGDGTTGTSSSHSYANAGNYLVTATTTFSHPTYASCTKVDTVTVRATGGNPAFNCANAHANFNYSNSGATYTFNNTTTYPTTSGVQVAYQWSGAFSASGSGSKTHTFTQNGTYTVHLKAIWSGSAGILCRDSITKTIIVTSATPPPPNVITASANWDSTINAAGASVKMWLIQYDSSTQTLSAVDSALIPVTNGSVPYVVHDFAGKSAGSYRVKAHMLNQPSSWTTGFLPTYATNAAYWANAAVINHSGTTAYANAWLQQGTPMTGPGFISGSVLQGANKGTAVGDPMGNITIFLRNSANNTLVASTETDANGTYTFNNVPVGSYNIYPEEINYTTTPSQAIQITASGNRSTANDFWRETVAKTLHPITPAGVRTVTEAEVVQISPNPAKDQLNIHFATAPQKGSTVQLYNLNGQVVKTFEISNAQTTQQFSLSGLAAGNYLVHIPTQSGKQVARITVQP